MLRLVTHAVILAAIFVAMLAAQTNAQYGYGAPAPAPAAAPAPVAQGATLLVDMEGNCPPTPEAIIISPVSVFVRSGQEQGCTFHIHAIPPVWTEGFADAINQSVDGAPFRGNLAKGYVISSSELVVSLFDGAMMIGVPPLAGQRYCRQWGLHNPAGPQPLALFSWEPLPQWATC